MTNLVIFDGMTGSGKTTLRYKLFYAANYILTIDRFTPTCWVFDRLRGNMPDQKLFEVEKKMNELDALVVISFCDPEVSRKRALINSFRTIDFTPEKEYAEYNNYLEVSQYNNIMKVNSTNSTVDEILSKVLERMRADKIVKR